MKAAKFTEAQNQEGAAAEFDSVGSIVQFCEKEGGFISPTKITAPQDVIDTIIMDNRSYLNTLVNNDPNLSQLFENYLKKLEIQEQMENDEAEGTQDPSYEDYEERMNQLLQEKTEDESLLLTNEEESEE